jgi:hypothetical protein
VKKRRLTFAAAGFFALAVPLGEAGDGHHWHRDGECPGLTCLQLGEGHSEHTHDEPPPRAVVAVPMPTISGMPALGGWAGNTWGLEAHEQ